MNQGSFPTSYVFFKYRNSRHQKLLKNKYEDLDTESKEESSSESEPDSAVPTVVRTGTAESWILFRSQCLSPCICF